MSRKPTEQNLTIYKGRDFTETFVFTNAAGTAIDLTSWSVKAQIRRNRSRDSALIVKFTAAISDPASDGEVVLTLTDTQTAKITQKTGYYDLMLTNASAFDESYATGKVTFVESVTAKRDLLAGTIAPEITLTGELGE